MSLNEIVNCPTKFASFTPYLVVQFVDWIQCRYLFVQSGGTGVQARSTTASWSVNGLDDPLDLPLTSLSLSNADQEVEQDPKYTARSTIQKPIGVPRCAATISRAFRADAISSEKPTKKHKNTPSTTRSKFEDWAVSEEDVDDIQFLMTDDEDSMKGKGKSL